MVNLAIGLIWILINGAFSFNAALAEEVDDFTPVSGSPKNAAPVIDLATNTLLDELILLLNQSNLKSCNDPLKYQLTLKKLDQNFTAIGNGLRAGKELKELLELMEFDKINQAHHQKRLHQVQDTWLAEFAPEKRDWFTKLFSSVEYFGPRTNENSIYRKLDYLTCCTSRINVNDVYVGLDKIDHFFGNAGLLFEQFLHMDSKTPLQKRLEDLMKINVRQEHTLWGLRGLSPKSYGDLAANWQGFHFYRELFDEAPVYIQCHQGQFQRNPQRIFQIKNYLDEAWNESTNCSSFATDLERSQFQSNLTQAKLQCPRSASICKDLVQKHQADPLFIIHTLSPLCSAPTRPFKPVETPIDISWDEVELSFRGFTWPIIKDLAFKKGAEILSSLLPDFLKNQSIQEGERLFARLKACRQYKNTERLQCLKNYTEPGLSTEQLQKFSSLLENSIDFSQLVKCSNDLNTLEKQLHPIPIGDMSLCFHTQYRNSISVGRIYFRRHKDQLKIVLLRM